MRKLTVLVDMDDTLENLCEALVVYLNRIYKTNVLYTDIRKWDIAQYFPSVPRDEIFKPLYTEAFWDTVKPLDSAPLYLQKLIDDGHRVVVVTASAPETVPLKLSRVLFRYFPFLSYKDVVVTSQKDLIKGDVLVDDAPHNFKDGATYRGILMSAPHNRDFDETAAGLIRANNWGEIYRIVSTFAYDPQKGGV